MLTQHAINYGNVCKTYLHKFKRLAHNQLILQTNYRGNRFQSKKMLQNVHTTSLFFIRHILIDIDLLAFYENIIFRNIDVYIWYCYERIIRLLHCR